MSDNLVALAERGHPIEYLMAMDFVSFERLLESSERVANARRIESMCSIRTAMNAEKKDFEKIVNELRAATTRDGGDAKLSGDAFASAIKGLT